MELKRNIVRIGKLEDEPEAMETSASERISSVWDITAEIWGIATKGLIDVESRLQRDVVSFTRPES